MPLRAEDLPPALRKRLGETAGPIRGRTRVRREAKGKGTPYRCNRCQQTFDSWPAAERHANTSHHPRYEAIL